VGWAPRQLICPCCNGGCGCAVLGVRGCCNVIGVVGARREKVPRVLALAWIDKRRFVAGCRALRQGCGWALRR